MIEKFPEMPIGTGVSGERFMGEALRLARESAGSGAGGPFGAVIVRDGQIIGRGVNRVTSRLDPTAHAEVVAIRDACTRVGDFRLAGAILYASCLPCPMCFAAIYWARIDRLYYAASAEQAAAAGFDDLLIAAELRLPPAQRSVRCRALLSDQGGEPFAIWAASPDKRAY